MKYTDPSNDSPQQAVRISNVMDFPNLQAQLRQMWERDDEIVTDGELAQYYPKQLTSILLGQNDRKDRILAAERAVYLKLCDAVKSAVENGAVTDAQVGTDSGLLTLQADTPLTKINQATGNAIVGNQLTSFFSAADLNALLVLRQKAYDYAALQTALAYWIVDFHRYMWDNPNATPPTWEWVIGRYPMPQLNEASVGLSKMPTWLWLALGAAALFFGA